MRRRTLREADSAPHSRARAQELSVSLVENCLGQLKEMKSKAA